MGLVVMWFIASLVSELAICKPTRKLWELLIDGTCGDVHKMCNAVGVIHAILDFTVLMIPMPLIWNLKMSNRTKIFLSTLLLCGVL